MYFFIGITINLQHILFNDDIKEVLEDLKVLNKGYIEIVKHKSTTSEIHYHVLIESKYSPNWWKEQKIGHIEAIRNVKAYQKYMNNHDMLDKVTFGDMPYFENNKNEIIDYVMKYGPVKTVQTYGWEALNKYNQLKLFYEDLREFIAINGKL